MEAKAVEEVLPIRKARLLSYMKLLDVPLGLIIDFHALKLADGVSRLILPGNECVVTVVGYREVPAVIDPAAPDAPEAPPAEGVPAAAAPAGILRAPPAPVDPSVPEEPVESAPPARIPITRSVQVGTTIPPDVLDPNAPLPMVAISSSVGRC